MHIVQESLSGNVRVFSVKPNTRQKYDLEIFTGQVTSLVTETLQREHLTHPQIKFQLALHVSFVKQEYDDTGDSTPRYVDPYFLSESRIYDAQNILSDYDELNRSVAAKFDTFIEQGSGFTLKEILEFRLKVHRFTALQGGSGLPKFIYSKRGCLNIHNVGQLCFIYACLAHLHPEKNNPRLPSSYTRFMHELDTSHLTFPLSLSGVKRFEKQNTHLSINVLGYEKTHFIPLYRTVNRTGVSKDKRINLLLYRKHYYLITNMSRLLNSMDGVRRRHTSYYCHSCLCRYSSQKRLDEHYNLCRDNLQALKVPDASNRLIQFTNFRNVFRVPFVIYYDIESMLVPSETEKTTNHVPISICAFTKCTVDTHSSRPRVFTGKDCIELFLKHLKEEEKRIVRILATHHSELSWNDDDEDRLLNAQECDVCHMPFDVDHPKYRDHDHLNDSGDTNVRFITCNRCNLNFGRQRTTCRIPIIAHN
jgi:hypothetical protein